MGMNKYFTNNQPSEPLRTPARGWGKHWATCPGASAYARHCHPYPEHIFSPLRRKGM